MARSGRSSRVTSYILNEHDDHLLRATKTMHLACVFTPGLTGKEVHREDGSYAPAEA